jgi:hypothetical protein
LTIQTSNNKINGNTAHSTGWWWHFAGGFYFGGELFYNRFNGNKLTYNPGRGNQYPRNPCKNNPCLPNITYCSGCRVAYQDWVRITNIKTFLIAGVGLVRLP